MTRIVALAAAEARMLARNRTVAFNALALPLGFGVLWLWAYGTQAAPGGPIAALQVVAVLTFTLFSVATTTLVARRQQRVLKRWRTSPLSTGGLLAGTLAPLAALFALQAVVLLSVTAVATESVPARPELIVVAVLAGAVLCSALGFATAAFTRTVETATVTATPVVLALLGGSVWTLNHAPGEVTWAMLATGGGALAHVVRVAWDGPGGLGLLAEITPALGATAALTLAAVVVAVRVFRWEPRA